MTAAEVAAGAPSAGPLAKKLRESAEEARVLLDLALRSEFDSEEQAVAELDHLSPSGMTAYYRLPGEKVRLCAFAGPHIIEFDEVGTRRRLDELPRSHVVAERWQHDYVVIATATACLVRSRP